MNRFGQGGDGTELPCHLQERFGWQPTSIGSGDETCGGIQSSKFDDCLKAVFSFIGQRQPEHRSLFRRIVNKKDSGTGLLKRHGTDRFPPPAKFLFSISWAKIRLVISCASIMRSATRFSLAMRPMAPTSRESWR
jgi:hypothetical protein